MNNFINHTKKIETTGHYDEGKYKITVDDIAKGTKFNDSVAAYAFVMDVHPRTPYMTGSFKIQSAEVYCVPYRSMLPIDCDNAD